MTPAREYRINHQEIFETCTNLPVRNDSGEKNETILSGASRIISLSFLSHPMKRSSCQSASAVDECVPPNAAVAAPSSFDANPPQTSGVSSDLQLRKQFSTKICKKKDALAKWSSGKTIFLKTSSKVWRDNWPIQWIYEYDWPPEFTKCMFTTELASSSLFSPTFSTSLEITVLQ